MGIMVGQRRLNTITRTNGTLEHPDSLQNAVDIGFQLFFTGPCPLKNTPGINTEGLSKTYAELFGTPGPIVQPHPQCN
jgi:hypothetical protein